MSRRCSKGKGKGEFARDETRILASRVSLVRACSLLRPLLPSSCYAGHENSLLLPCCLVHCFFSFQSLQECIRALGRKGAHLPFRASKLTQVRNFRHSQSRQLLCQGRIGEKLSLSNVQKWWAKAPLNTLCKPLCGDLLFAVLFYSTGSQRLIHRRELENLYGKVRLWMKL